MGSCKLMGVGEIALIIACGDNDWVRHIIRMKSWISECLWLVP
jgi:hypothetical protein